MRVYLTQSELQTKAGEQLLELLLRVAKSGELHVNEIEELRSWLNACGDESRISAIPYLRICVERLFEDLNDGEAWKKVHLAIERVVPKAQREHLVDARTKIEERKREEMLELERRLHHTFAKVWCVRNSNDDGSLRQEIIARCQPGEPLLLRQDLRDTSGIPTFQVVRANGEQLGYAPRYLAQQVRDQVKAGFSITSILSRITGGEDDKLTHGVNFITFFAEASIPNSEVEDYIERVLAEFG